MFLLYVNITIICIYCHYQLVDYFKVEINLLQRRTITDALMFIKNRLLVMTTQILCYRFCVNSASLSFSSNEKLIETDYTIEEKKDVEKDSKGCVDKVRAALYNSCMREG